MVVKASSVLPKSETVRAKDAATIRTRAQVYIVSPQIGRVGGAAVATLLLIESLRRSGYSVLLFVTLPPAPDISDELRALGVGIFCPYVNKGWSFGFPALQIAFRLRLAASRGKPQCIISVGLSNEALHALRLRVLNVHLWETTEALPDTKFINRRIRNYLHLAAGLIAPSKTIEANMRSTYGFEGRIRRLPFWCAKPSPFAQSARLRGGHFVYVGRLDPDKGLLQLSEAFKQLEKDYPEARLTIAGAGSFPTLGRAIDDAANITFRGYVERDAYETLLAAADVCILPSLHEGYPLSLIEACGRSKPVIATRVGSIPEIFEGSRAALLVPPDDIHALANGVATLLRENSSEYQDRCADARRLYNELADLDVIDRQVRALIQEIGGAPAT